MRNGTHICELSGERWIPAELRMLPFDRDNWYCASEVDERCPVAPPSLFGLETCGREPRWLPVRQVDRRSKGSDEPTFIVRIDTGEYTDTLSTHSTREEAERAGGDWLMMIKGVETREDVLDECSYEILEERK
tara:strand:- start:1188 stop:1586 length:399 start_codon:yes stop_codon:yes gene_type:complete